MGQSDPSKTEEATPKRVDKSRQEGNVIKSQEVSKAITVLAGLVGAILWMPYMGRELEGLFRHFLTAPTLKFSPTLQEMTAMGEWLSWEIAKLVLPIILFIGFWAYLVLRWQVGSLWTTKVFVPKLSKFNVLSGLKRMFFSSQTFIRLGRSLLQAIVIGIAPWLVIRKEMDSFITLYYSTAAGVASYLLDMSKKMVTYALVPMIIIAAVDYWYTRWNYFEQLKMTKDEIKDERKQSEGDPIIKSKQRQKMMQAMAKRMMQEVPKADVIVTNPTHIAVALRYDQQEAPAPIVVAKGADRVAEKIKEIAREHKVPIRENKPLARALYSQVEIGDVIPEDLYKVVASLLAQIWKMKGKYQQ
ncbi:flagellar biosynthesis protein FlhB [Desulfovibrio litoralis]|uniref:Flagellar biosynthetic protein FlhB n=1 Tax=Desulfovibrio litoralis DSM 11393 TaxID=1121455 RepID=A0A1M7TCY1_9BACT|nr:flagellar biosynthesis protein FlhB [Desulfovibrio litoralis]SHN68527.1 flagellar biosynthetic protein FlhB [Desulfovibrio litoralis DSM 11393]